MRATLTRLKIRRNVFAFGTYERCYFAIGKCLTVSLSITTLHHYVTSFYKARLVIEPFVPAFLLAALSLTIRTLLNYFVLRTNPNTDYTYREIVRDI